MFIENFKGVIDLIPTEEFKLISKEQFDKLRVQTKRCCPICDLGETAIGPKRYMWPVKMDGKWVNWSISESMRDRILQLAGEHEMKDLRNKDIVIKSSEKDGYVRYDVEVVG